MLVRSRSSRDVSRVASSRKSIRSNSLGAGSWVDACASLKAGSRRTRGVGTRGVPRHRWEVAAGDVPTVAKGVPAQRVVISRRAVPGPDRILGLIQFPVCEAVERLGDVEQGEVIAPQSSKMVARASRSSPPNCSA